jgi:hypothetical protein
MHARVKKLNPHANTLTKQIEILPLYLLKGTVQSVLLFLTTAMLQTIKKEYSWKRQTKGIIHLVSVLDAREGKKVKSSCKYPGSGKNKMNEINPKYENTRKII